jgi:hypothetical protein
MTVTPANVKQRLEAYCNQNQMELIEPRLGWGQDGEVYSSNRRTAVKGFRYPEQYRQELRIYERLRDRGVTNVEGFAVPQLISFSPEFAVIEMEIVQPPFVVDFVAAYLDGQSPFTPKELREADRTARQRFGADWPQVQSIRAAFRRFGIHLGDLKPDNIRFR